MCTKISPESLSTENASSKKLVPSPSMQYTPDPAPRKSCLQEGAEKKTSHATCRRFPKLFTSRRHDRLPCLSGIRDRIDILQARLRASSIYAQTRGPDETERARPHRDTPCPGNGSGGSLSSASERSRFHPKDLGTSSQGHQQVKSSVARATFSGVRNDFKQRLS